jgi:hypothetical protein
MVTIHLTDAEYVAFQSLVRKVADLKPATVTQLRAVPNPPAPKFKGAASRPVARSVVTDPTKPTILESRKVKASHMKGWYIRKWSDGTYDALKYFTDRKGLDTRTPLSADAPRYLDWQDCFNVAESISLLTS